MVEHHLAKVGVAGSNPVFRFFVLICYLLFVCGHIYLILALFILDLVL